MPYNLTFTPETFGGHVPFIDTDHLRFIRGGLTIDAEQVAAVLAAGEAAGQAVMRNGRLTLLQGSFISQNPGTGRFEVYAPAFAATAATLETGDVTDDNDLYWEAQAAGVAGNDITVEIVDEMRGNPLPAVIVDGNDIKVVLANPTSDIASDDHGTATANNLLHFVAKQGGTDGDGIVIDTVVGTPDDVDWDVDVDLAARTIEITVMRAGGTTATAAEFQAWCQTQPEIMALIDVVHGLESDGSGAMTTATMTTAGGNDGDIDIGANSADDIAAAVMADAAAAALVDVTEGVVGTGNVDYEVARTNLAGGAQGNQAVQAGLITGVGEVEQLIRWRALDAYVGATGNAVAIEFVQPGAATPLSVAEAVGPPAVVTVTLETDAAGDVVSTAAEIVAEVQSEVALGNITFVDAELACAIGDGIVQPMDATNMTGGVDEAAANITNRYAAILFEDVDLQDGNAIANGIDHGRVLTARLPVAPDANVRIALPQVIFK